MQAFSSICCQISDLETMEAVLLAVLTDKEREAINNRLQIIQLLADKKPQREISSRLGVGIATVTRGAQAHKEGKFHVLQEYL